MTEPVRTSVSPRVLGSGGRGQLRLPSRRWEALRTTFWVVPTALVLVAGVLFAQLVEIAIRALSSAVNDTFTALTCIDWLSAGLSEISARVLDEGVYRGRSGKVRLIEFDPSYSRMVNRAFDKVHQEARGMPAVIIRMIDAPAHIAENTTDDRQRAVLLRQGEMILRGAVEEVPEPNDLVDIRYRFDRLVLATTNARPGGERRTSQDR